MNQQALRPLVRASGRGARILALTNTQFIRNDAYICDCREDANFGP